MKNIKTEVNFVNDLKTNNMAEFGKHATLAGEYLDKSIKDLLDAKPTLKMLTMEKFSENHIICSTVFDAVISKLPKDEQELARATLKERKEMTAARRKKAEAANKKGRRHTMVIIAGARGALSGTPKTTDKPGARVVRSMYARELETLQKFQKARSDKKEPTTQDIAIAAFWTKTIDLFKASFKPEA